MQFEKSLNSSFNETECTSVYRFDKEISKWEIKIRLIAS